MKKRKVGTALVIACVMMLTTVSSIATANDSTTNATTNATTIMEAEDSMVVNDFNLESSAIAVTADSVTEEVAATTTIATTTEAVQTTTEATTTEAIVTGIVPKVGDRVSVLDDVETRFIGSDGRYEVRISGEYSFYLIGMYEAQDMWQYEKLQDDLELTYRAYLPIRPSPERVLYVVIDPNVTYIRDHDGYVIGDLNEDLRVDAFDLATLRRIVIDGPETMMERILSDINGDTEVNVSDLVRLSRMVMGAKIEKPEYYSQEFWDEFWGS